MARKIIDTGIVGNDGTGDSIRDSFRKVNENFRELYSSLGLGERLTIQAMDDLRLNGSTESYYTLNPTNPFLNYENSILSVNEDESGVALKEIVGLSGVSVEFTNTQIQISSEFSALVADTSPKLGGDLKTRSDLQYRILDLGTDIDPLFPIYNHEATSKGYVDTKLARGGTETVDPATGEVNTAFGKMSGPLILSRDPEPDDDIVYDGLIAATKRYVDNAGFGSKVNLYVATSGQDDRPGVSLELQGRALSYAYRTLEAALKRAEEIILESRLEIGPYKKKLTYNGGASDAVLDTITDVPGAGSGFSGEALVSVDTIEINNPGQYYAVGDVVTLDASPSVFIQAAKIEVLSVGALPGTARGPVLTFRVLSSGVYSAIPGSTGVTTSNSDPRGVNLTFNVTYKVNNVNVLLGGTGYGLVSVRITPAPGDTTGTGAFGTADVVGTSVQSITITDQGSGFTDIPTVEVSLPRFLVKTEFFRTDFTGDVTTSTPSAIRGRDIREGLYIRGESSGALAQILSHSGELDTDGNEIFDVDIKYGTFVEGEALSYGDIAKETQITILVESGIYEENYPLKVPPNVSIVGDEFRRCIIRPRPGVSSSPWAFIYFRRDITIGGPAVTQSVYDTLDQVWELEDIPADTLVVTNRQFGYHYLTDTGSPVYPLVNNKGYYRSTAQLLVLNRTFLQKEVIAWIDNQIENGIAPFDTSFKYNSNLCERDIGLIIDSMVFDLRWGGSARTLSSALKYYSNASGQIAITDQLSETVAGIRRLLTLAQLVVKNVEITELYQTIVPQIIDNAWVAEVGTYGTSIDISGISDTDPVAVSTAGAHGFSSGQNIFISGVSGSTELNGNDFYVEVIDGTSFYLYNDLELTDPVNTASVSDYVSGGSVTNVNGVLGSLFEAFIDVIEGSASLNLPLNNDEMDVFLANDSNRWQAITAQGHGGFMLVLDPEGQILSRSPYAQECASFSKSTGRQTFAGGMFVDGFAGNIKFQILSKDSDTFLRVGGLKRFPQLPASFIVNDQVYRINYVRDYSFNVNGSTASFILDETTPWPYDLFTYEESICSRDVGYIIEGLGYDIVLESNYNTRKAALSYRQANASVVIDTQLDLTARAISNAHTAALAATSDYESSQSAISTSERVLNDVIRNGAVFAPPLILPNPPGLASNLANAKSLLLANISFIKDEVINYIASNYPVYNRDKCYRDVGYIIDAVMNDLVFGSNYQTTTAGLAYTRNITSSLYVLSDQKTQTIAGIEKARDLILAITTDSGAESTITSLFAVITNIINTGSGAAPALLYPTPGSVASGISNAASLIEANKAFLKAEITAWIDVQKAGEIAPFTSSFTYSSATCERDVGLLIDAIRYDLLYGGNTSSIVAGNAYYLGASIEGQVDETIAAFEWLGSVISDVSQNISITPSAGNVVPQVTGSAGSLAAAEILVDLIDSINSIIQGGSVTSVNPTYSLGNSTYAAERLLVQTDKVDIQQGVIDYLEDTDLVFVYDEVKCRRDVGYIIESLAYDLIYGGNSQTVDAGVKYYSSIISGSPLQIPADTLDATVAALGQLKDLAVDVIVNAAVGQVTGSASDAGTQTVVDTLLTTLIDIVENGLDQVPPTIDYPDLDAYVYQSDLKLAREALLDAKLDIQTTTIEFVNENANVYEVLMPGNRSMLSNDFTQINDMGYGLITTNGGLAEAVSMFTYYNFISYYSLNGGQIRSVGGSSSHGVYALVAEGADPLEVPTPVTLYYELAQGATCYFPDGLYTNLLGGQEIYVTNFDYVPMNNSEIEIDHGLGAIYRYPVTTVSTSGLPAGVAKLNIKSAEGFGIDGLAKQVPNGTKLTIRQASQVVLTGDVVEVATRPSTGLVLRESSTVYRILQFQDFLDTNGAKTVTFTSGTPGFVNRTGHGLLPGYQVSFTSTGDLPTGIIAGDIFYVSPDDFTEDRFAISISKNGIPVNLINTGVGVHSYIVEGLARTTLRENYDYIDLSIWPAQPYANSGVDTCTISIGDPAVITQVGHGLNEDDVVRFEVSFGGSLPGGISAGRHYFVKNVLNDDTFTITEESIPTSTEVRTTLEGSGTYGVGKVTGKVGDDTIAVVPVGPGDQNRVLGTQIVWKGETYNITQYLNEAATLEPYALIVLDRPLVDSAIFFTTPPSFKSAVPKDEPGTLTIRISLTRVTSHDLLEVGTGSYADTNYPSEIYGPPVNPINAANETQERDVGRVFYVTTDQFGNFNVGPYFRVDQGTGTVTFSAAIALSNLDGIGFKRGVPISEFSTDSSMSDNATDTVPTENATRTYIDRRLGLNHNGNIVGESLLIPTITGGFMSLDGQLAMKGAMNLGNNKIINVSDATNLLDAVNLQSLTFDNFQDTTTTGVAASDLLVFTGTDNQAINATVTGDITLTVNTGTNEINAQINSNTIINADVKSDAGIEQSKLAMNLAKAREAAPTGTAAAKQATTGTASVDFTAFKSTDGFVELQNTVQANFTASIAGTTLTVTAMSVGNLGTLAVGQLVTGAGVPTNTRITELGSGSGSTGTYILSTSSTVASTTMIATVEGVETNNLQRISSKTVLGNETGVTNNVTQVAFTKVVNDGGAVKKTQYSSGTGFLRRIGFTSTEDSDYTIIDMASGSSTSPEGSKLIVRDSNGDFGARNVDLSRLLIDTKTTIDTSTSATGGYTQYHGFLGQAGILIGDGSVSTDKRSYYDNDGHIFRLQSGLANAPITASTVFATALSTGAAGTRGDITGDWRLTAGSKLQATYADLAEYYEGDKDYEVGTVLVFGGEKEVTISSLKEDHRVAGVVSNTAAYSMNADCPGNKVLIALQGRVPCRVVGKIQKGDLLVTSTIQGVAVSAKGTARPGTIIGKALANYDSDHIGTVEVAVGRA